MIPIARTHQLLIQEVGNEFIIYDQINNTSHCLNPIAARVWELCNGRHTVEDIARILEKEFGTMTEEVDLRGLVWLTLEELEQNHLIGYVRQPKEVFGLPRRTVLKTAVLAGGFAVGSAFPMIKSIAAPEPGGAKSGQNGPKPPDCIPEGGACTPGATKPKDKCCQNAQMNIHCTSRTNRQPGQSEFACEQR